LLLLGGAIMANVDFDTTPFVEPSETKIFGTVETSVDFAKTFGEDVTLKRALSALQRGPGGFYRDNVIACDGDAADYMFFVVSGVVRQLQSLRKRQPQCRCLLSSRRPVRLERSETFAFNRSRDRHGGSIS